MLGYLGLSMDHQDSDDVLEKAGQSAIQVMKTSAFSSGGGTESASLNNYGYALAADMGLLVSRCLLRDFPDRVYWETLRKPKSNLSYNLPVLKGFGNRFLEPVGVSITDSLWCVRGKEDETVWKRLYIFLAARVPGNGD